MRVAVTVMAAVLLASAICAPETIPLAEPGYEPAYGDSAAFAFTPTGAYESVC